MSSRCDIGSRSSLQAPHARALSRRRSRACGPAVRRSRAPAQKATLGESRRISANLVYSRRAARQLKKLDPVSTKTW